MAITLALKKGLMLYAYDGNRQLFSIYVSPNAEVVGYTANTVTTKVGMMLITYDEKGNEISRRFV